MGLFIDVSELAGDCVVQGQVRRCEYKGGGTHTNGALTIHGLTLADAMSVLKALGTDSVITASLSGVLPATPVQAAPQQAPAAPAPPPAQAPQPTEQRPEIAPPAMPPTAPPAAPEAPAAAPQQGTAVQVSVAGVQAEVHVPDDVMKASTLRPVVAWLHEQGTAPTVEAMYPQVRAIIGRMPKVSPLARITDDDLRTRIKSTLERLDILGKG